MITVYKVVVGLVTPERLIAVALGALGLYIIWIFCSLIGSFQRKFNTRCQQVINDVLKNKEIEKHPELLDKKIDKISSGFGFGWKKFRKSLSGKPSDFIKRREALDVEINGGVLNNGKTMMRAYIAFVTAVLFIFNFAYVGGENAITFITLAETIMLPFVFYVVVKLFYFLHNSIKQKFYRMDIESFYEVIDLLDTKFAKKVKVVEVEEEASDEDENLEKEPEEATNEETETQENTQETGLDKYDVFKKKNIDVSKIMNEVPKADSTLPHINVDSDYVIKDDDEVGAKSVGQEDNASTIFGGMMQNTSGLKKNNFVDIEKNIAEIDEEKLEKINNLDSGAQTSSEESAEDFEKIETGAENVELTEGEFIDGNVTLGSLIGNVSEVENEVEEPPVSENTSKFIEIEKNEENSAVQEQENIASVVSGFKASRSKLASGGMVIERNEPIAKRDRGGFLTNERDEVASEEQKTSYAQQERSEPENVITRPEANTNADAVLSTLKSVQGNYDGYPMGQNFAPSTNYGNVGFDQNYGYQNPMQSVFVPQMNAPMQGYPYAAEPAYQNYGGGSFAQNYGEPNPQIDEFNEDLDETEEFVETNKKQETAQKKKKVRTKEEEPRPRNLKSAEKKQTKKEESPVVKRGRPKKQEVSESMVIENDEQFNEILSRAEKLMRKSEEGLSESQSKRIEKEIKILMDAMNRYKEGK